MKTVQMTLDESLIAQVDLYVTSHKTTRSAFARLALESESNRQLEIELELELEQQQIDGYKSQPIKSSEFKLWANEQEWAD